MNTRQALSFISVAVLTVSCTAPRNVTPVIPAVEFSKRMHEQSMSAGEVPGARVPMIAGASTVSANPPISAEVISEKRAKLRLAGGDAVPDAQFGTDLAAAPDTVTNMYDDPSYTVQESRNRLTRDYNGPLVLGDPGVTASLWHESKGTNDLFRDNRAWRPMDLITIVVKEKSKGEKTADTEIKSKSDVAASISAFLGVEKTLKKANPNIDPDALVEASTKNDFKGEGDTNREGSLVATISAMVVEVLPGEILRIEGEKIISVNSEEETMVISGLVRPEDVDSNNAVDSAKIADMRIDYYGTGTVGDAQHGGWMGRLMKRWWPF